MLGLFGPKPPGCRRLVKLTLLFGPGELEVLPAADQTSDVPDQTTTINNDTGAFAPGPVDADTVGLSSKHMLFSMRQLTLGTPHRHESLIIGVN